jgi:antitoxin PrlF
MIRSRVTNCGRTTIPAAVREALGLKPLQQIVYEVRPEGVLIRPEGESFIDVTGSKTTASESTFRAESATPRIATGRWQR